MCEVFGAVICRFTGLLRELYRWFKSLTLIWLCDGPCAINLTIHVYLTVKIHRVCYTLVGVCRFDLCCYYSYNTNDFLIAISLPE